MKKLARLVVIFLILLMILPYNAMAADNNIISKRQEDLNFLWDTLKEKHPNIFANTAEDKFEAKKAEIEANIDKRTDLEFALDLSSLLAMIGDSHTSISIGSSSDDIHFLPISVEYFEGDWILSTVEKKNEAFLGQSIIAINNIPVKEISERFKSIISADNDIKLLRQIKGEFYVEEILDYLNIADKGATIPVTVRDNFGKTSEFTVKAYPASDRLPSDTFISLSQKRVKAPATSFDKSKKYKSMPLDESTYYIQYNACSQDKENPMATFSQQVKNDIDSGKYTKVVLDLRNNGGGSDGVIMPLLTMLSDETRQKNIKLYGLTGEATFSSAIINSIMVKEAGGILVGSLTSGSVNHFGSVNSFTLPNSGLKVGCSSKFIRMSDYFEAGNGYGVEPLRPDILKGQTLSDYIAGVDTTVDYLLTNGDNISLPVNKDEGLSRGRAVDMLYKAANKNSSNSQNGNNSFKDLFEFAYYTPAVEWAYGNGIIKGSGGETFEPTRLITREELAAILQNFVHYLKIIPHEKNETVSFSDEAAISTWARSAAKWACEWGLLDTKSGEFRPKDTLTRLEAETMLQKLMGN